MHQPCKAAAAPTRHTLILRPPSPSNRHPSSPYTPPGPTVISLPEKAHGVGCLDVLISSHPRPSPGCEQCANTMLRDRKASIWPASEKHTPGIASHLLHTALDRRETRVRLPGLSLPCANPSSGSQSGKRQPCHPVDWGWAKDFVSWMAPKVSVLHPHASVIAHRQTHPLLRPFAALHSASHVDCSPILRATVSL